jgi:putative Mg2+ transporter-C (MgtC) family protein
MSSWFQRVGEAVAQDFSDLSDGPALARAVVRLLMAAVLGGVIGWQREITGKAAGLRTHMIVAVGAALFVLAPLQMGSSSDSVSRIVQGLAAGIGFLGAGVILKSGEEKQVRGLTTAATIWLTAAVGVTVGIGRLMTAILATLLALLILSVLAHWEHHIDSNNNKPK